MKRWLPYGFAAIAVLLLLTPGLIGLLAERSVEQQLEAARRLDPAFGARTVRFERGWFASAGRHRVPLNDPELVRLLRALLPGGGVSDEPAVLVIDTRLDHGIVPLAAATRDVTALLPALARGVSTMHLEVGDGTLLALPGRLESRIGLGGTTSLRYRLPPGDETRGATRARWQGAELALELHGDSVAVDATFDRWRLENDGRLLEFDSARLTAEGRPTPWGYAAGQVRLAFDNASTAAGGDAARWDALELAAAASQRQQHIDATVSVRILGLESTDGRYDADLALALDDLDGRRLAPLLRGLQAAGFARDAGLPPYPEFDLDLRWLLAAGAELAIRRGDVDTPQGPVRVHGQLSVPPADGVPGWPSFALAASGTLELAMARARVEPPSPMAAGLRPWLASGFLVPDGDRYVMRAEITNGRVTVNGAPLPLSLLFTQDF